MVIVEIGGPNREDAAFLLHQKWRDVYGKTFCSGGADDVGLRSD